MKCPCGQEVDLFGYDNTYCKECNQWILSALADMGINTDKLLKEKQNKDE